MIYIKKLTLPSEFAEAKVIEREKRTCFNTFYPFKIFPEMGLGSIDFDSITMLYGGNGSGKSTLINVLAHKMRAARYSEFNDAPLFDRFTEMCSLDYMRTPRRSSVLTSDDVFDYVLKARTVNENISEQRNELFDKYVAIHGGAERNPDFLRLKGLDDYERWSETMEILSPRKSQSSYVKKRTARDIDLYSNGQTAMRYFLERIEDDAVYLLDEPENSLSIEFQIELAEYISATARVGRTQFIIATHSPFLLSMQGARIYDLDTAPVSVKKWTELENVKIYRDFFEKHKNEF